ncbi:hypothetical protein EON66_06555 [archaeon]|nr:MAG: hypothetical protein EON66_06555 [archaeon]
MEASHMYGCSLSGMSHDECADIVHACSYYVPRALLRLHKASVSSTYDGTFLSFVHAASALRSNIALRAYGMHACMSEVLDALQREFEALQLGDVSAIVLQSVGSACVAITNTSKRFSASAIPVAPSSCAGGCQASVCSESAGSVFEASDECEEEALAFVLAVNDVYKRARHEGRYASSADAAFAGGAACGGTALQARGGATSMRASTAAFITLASLGVGALIGAYAPVWTIELKKRFL